MSRIGNPVRYGKRIKQKLFAILACISLVGCGGESAPDRYQQAVDDANAKEAEARALAPNGPCTEVSQCAALTFLSPQGSCPGYYYKPYSLVSSTASAASAAAAAQRELGAKAASLAPTSNVACAAVINPPPNLACLSSLCEAKQ